MIDQKDFLEGAINSLEETSKEINGLKDALLGSSLEQFRYIFDLNTDKTPIFKELKEEEVLEIKNTLKGELLPLFEENEYNKGVEQIQEWVKLLEGDLV
jgi:hypothetical protein